jgi:hypothetical protein
MIMSTEDFVSLVCNISWIGMSATETTEAI